MRFQTISIIDICAAILIVLLGLWGATQESISDSPNDTLALIYDGRMVISWSIAGLLFAANIYRHVRPDIQKRRIRLFLQSLHTRYFKTASGENDHDYRVSLFVPTRRYYCPFVLRRETVDGGHRWRISLREYPRFTARELRLFARSTDIHPKSALRWSISKSQNGDYDGIAGYSMVAGGYHTFDDLPVYDETDEEGKQRYCAETYISEEKVEKLHMRACSYRSLVIESAEARKVAVLMMESISPDGMKRKISKNSLRADAQHLQALFIA